MRKSLPQQEVKTHIEGFQSNITALDKEVQTFLSRTQLPDNTFQQVLSIKKKLEKLIITVKLALIAVNEEDSKFQF